VEQYEKETSRTLSWSHLSVIVVGESVAREGLSKPLDYFTREREMQRRVKLVVAREEAKPVLEVNPKVDKIVGFYLPRVLSLASKQNNRSIDMTLGEFVSRVDPEMGFLVPRVRPAQDALVVAGLAAFRGDKLIGWLGETETKGAAVLIRKCQGGIVEFTAPGGKKVAYRSRRAKVKWKPHVKGDKVSFTVDISLDGELEEVEANWVNAATFTAMSQSIAAEFKKQGEEARGVAQGTLTLYINDKAVGSMPMKTQPGKFGIGSYINIGHSGGSTVTADYTAPFTFTGGTINRVVVDVSGELYLNMEREAEAKLRAA
jgi:Ger(x)C family germination protein